MTCSFIENCFFLVLRGEGRGLLGRFWWVGQTKGGSVLLFSERYPAAFFVVF